MADLYRIAIVGTKGADRQYVSGTPNNVKLVRKREALHWDKATAKILTKHFNEHLEENFQIEKS